MVIVVRHRMPDDAVFARRERSQRRHDAVTRHHRPPRDAVAGSVDNNHTARLSIEIVTERQHQPIGRGAKGRAGAGIGMIEKGVRGRGNGDEGKCTGKDAQVH
jgi:hypothetical protein